MADKTKTALLEISCALRDMILADGHDQTCKIVGAGGCDCGAWGERMGAREEGIRVLLKHQELLAQMK